MSFLEQLDELTKAESAGGGYIGLVNVQFGYRVFVPKEEEEIDREESFFVVKNIGDDDGRKKILEQAKAFVEKHGLTKWNDKKEKELALKPFMSCHIVIKAKDVLNKDVDWEDDRWITLPFFTSGWKKVMRPSIDEVRLPDAGEHYLRLSYMIDPDNPTRFNQDGDEQDNLVPFIAELYESLEDAVKAVGTPVDNTASDGGEDTPDPPGDDSAQTPPDGWEWDAWEQSWDDIRDELKTASKKSVADDYGVKVADINKIPK